jgi:hypothetical protein
METPSEFKTAPEKTTLTTCFCLVGDPGMYAIGEGSVSGILVQVFENAAKCRN